MMIFASSSHQMEYCVKQINSQTKKPLHCLSGKQLGELNVMTVLYGIAWDQGCRSLLSIGGDNLQFYPNFALFSTLGGMNLDQEFVQVSKLSEDQKKGLHQKWNTFFQRWSPRGRPWPRGRPRGHILKFLALALASRPQVLENCPVLGSRTALFFESSKFCWKTPETSRKICKYLFCFPEMKRRRSQSKGTREPTPQIEISSMIKMCQKSLLFLQFQFLFSIFLLATVTNNKMEDQGLWAPFNSIFTAILNV